MEQARSGGGTLGVLKGVGQGSVGLFTKPGSGESMQMHLICQALNF